jgi:PAS domain S-box-containing protein
MSEKNGNNGAVDANEIAYRSLLSALPAPLYICDASGLITLYNEAAVELWGRRPELGKESWCGSYRIFRPDGTPMPLELCPMGIALSEGRSVRGEEIVIERPDGVRRHVLPYPEPIRDRTGAVVGAINMLVDITERKEAEEALREADRRKDEFLAALAHELRNPLAPITAGLEIIRLADDRTIRDRALAMMGRQIQQMTRLIDDLLDLSRISRGTIELRPERTDLGTVVQNAVEIGRPSITQGGHRLEVSIPADVITVEVDIVRMAQVFANLLNNAAKFTPEGGQIRLVLEQVDQTALVTVNDNGIGIPADLLPRVFDMFVQGDRALERSRGGLGVGLSIAKQLVEMHGGVLEAHSQGTDTGSEFTVRLPIAAPAKATAAPEEARDRAPVCGKILVVDDNALAASSLAELLRLMGNEVVTANDGLEAIERADEFRPRLILLDIGMPQLNGLEACRRIRAAGWAAEVVIVAVTGWGQTEIRRHADAAGFDYHVVKPVSPDALHRLLVAERSPSALASL